MSLPDPRPVREVDRADETAFRAAQEAGEPVLFRGLAADWPLVAAGRGGAAGVREHLRPHLTGARVQAFESTDGRGRFTYTDDLSGFTFRRHEVGLRDVLDSLVMREADPGAPALYAGGVNVPGVVPGLAGELTPPLLPVGTDHLASLWLGTRSSVPAHWDLPQNLAACVAGARRFTLFPTDQVPNLYIGPLERTVAGQPSSLVDVDAPDLARFPRYAEAAAHALVADLAPGDALYVPSLWLHAVRSDGPFGMLVNFWWRDGPAHLVTPMLTLMHAQLTLRGMPRREREAWRVLFDAYAFADDPAPHLPEAAKGVIGEATPERLGWLRRMLARSLGR